MSKQPTSARLILGPESSGTRFVTGILINSGCAGDAGHGQRWDSSMPYAKNHPHIVWRKSVPHGGAWPKITFLLKKLAEHGYQDILVIVLIREPFALHRSQVKRGHVPNLKVARRNVQKAYLHIFTHLAKSKARFVVISYEALALHGVPGRRAVLAELGLKLCQPQVSPRNANAKHYK